MYNSHNSFVREIIDNVENSSRTIRNTINTSVGRGRASINRRLHNPVSPRGRGFDTGPGRRPNIYPGFEFDVLPPVETTPPLPREDPPSVVDQFADITLSYSDQPESRHTVNNAATPVNLTVRYGVETTTRHENRFFAGQFLQRPNFWDLYLESVLNPSIIFAISESITPVKDSDEDISKAA